jgi:hypothetical protein
VLERSTCGASERREYLVEDLAVLTGDAHVRFERAAGAQREGDGQLDGLGPGGAAA